MAKVLLECRLDAQPKSISTFRRRDVLAPGNE